MKLLFVSIHQKTFPKNMAQGPRPAKAHLRHAERIRRIRWVDFKSV